jgi:hypothetical protein
LLLRNPDDQLGFGLLPRSDADDVTEWKRFPVHAVKQL